MASIGFQFSIENVSLPVETEAGLPVSERHRLELCVLPPRGPALLPWVRSPVRTPKWPAERCGSIELLWASQRPQPKEYQRKHSLSFRRNISERKRSRHAGVNGQHPFCARGWTQPFRTLCFAVDIPKRHQRPGPSVPRLQDEPRVLPALRTPAAGPAPPRTETPPHSYDNSF